MGHRRFLNGTHYFGIKKALLRAPGTHHRELKQRAYELRKAGFIDRDELCDLLEWADAALGYAVEELLEE